MNEHARATALSLRLPVVGGGLETFRLSAPRDYPARASGPHEPHRLLRRPCGGGPAQGL